MAFLLFASEALVIVNPGMAKTGDIIWAKLRGYPWWPAEVIFVIL